MKEKKGNKMLPFFCIIIYTKILTNMINDQFKIDSSLFASKGHRLANYITDRIVFTLGMYAFGIVIGVAIGLFAPEKIYILDAMAEVNIVLDYIISGILFSCYYLMFEATTQRSLGKYLTRTVVVDQYGQKPKFGSIVARSFCRLIPFNSLSFLIDQGRGWHDTIPNTYVVSTKKLKEAKALHQSLNRLGNDNQTGINQDN